MWNSTEKKKPGESPKSSQPAQSSESAGPQGWEKEQERASDRGSFSLFVVFAQHVKEGVEVQKLDEGGSAAFEKDALSDN